MKTKTLKITTDDKISVIEVDVNNIKDLQNAIGGGLVEPVKTQKLWDYFKAPVLMLVDEEGLLKDLPLNFFGSGIGTGVAYYDLYSNRDGKRLTLASGTYKLVTKGRSKCNVSVNNGVNSAKNEGTFTITDGHNDVWCYIEAPKGLALDETIYPMIQLASSTDESYEPYTGGKPSPSPDYPQEIKSVVNPTIKVCGKNLLQPNLRYNDRVKINIKKGVKLTLICKNGVVSKGGNLKFEKANSGISWFGFDKGNVKQQITLYDDVVAFYYLFNQEPSESYQQA